MAPVPELLIEMGIYPMISVSGTTCIEYKLVLCKVPKKFQRNTKNKVMAQLIKYDRQFYTCS